MTTFDEYIIVFEYTVTDIYHTMRYLRTYPQMHLEVEKNKYFYSLKPHLMLLSDYMASHTYWVNLDKLDIFTVPFEIPKVYKIFPEQYIIRQAKKLLKNPEIKRQFLASKMK